MFRRLINKWKTLVGLKELVGVDASGNKYYRFQQKEAGYTGRITEKREVDLQSRGDYDPNHIPAEWLAWLHKYRIEPPTVEECAKIAADKAQRSARIARIEAEEQQRKFRLASLNAEGMAAESTHNMQRYVEQLTSLGYGNEEKPINEEEKMARKSG